MAPWVIAGLAGVAIGVGAYQTGIKLYPDSLMSYIRGGNLVEPCPEPTLMNRAQEMLGAGVERLRASVVRRGAIPFSIAEYLPASTREWLYDTPDMFGTTAFQRMVRDGHIYTARKLMQGIAAEAIETSPTFTRGMVDAVMQGKGQEMLEKIDLSYIDWDHLEVVQNSGVSSVRDIGGQLIRFPGVEAADAYNQLMTRKYGQDAAREAVGALNVLINPRHTFVNLAAEATSFSQTIGKYPSETRAVGLLGWVARGINWTFGLQAGSLPQLLLARHVGYFSDEVGTGHAYLADTRATTKLIYALDANKLNKVANLIQFKLSAELGDFTEELDYHFLGANCMGFAQEIVQRGLDTRGSLVDHITEEQFAAHSLLTAPMDNQAMFYAWLTTLSTAVRSVMMIGLLRA